MISTTADPTAVNRALYTELPYAKEIARAFGIDLDAPEYQALLNERKALSAQDVHYAGSVSILDGRYRSTDEALALVNPQAVLELAAGFGPRGLDSANRFAMYLETDQPHVIQRKEAIVDHILPGRNRYQYQLRPLDVLAPDSLQSAGKIFGDAGIDHIAVVHEGLYFYLSRDEQRTVRDAVAEFLSRYSPRGVWVTPDLRYEAAGDEKSREMRQRFEQLAGRPWTCFASDEEVADFMREGGLSVRFLENEHLAGTLASERIVELRNPLHTRNWLREVRAAIVTRNAD